MAPCFIHTDLPGVSLWMLACLDALVMLFVGNVTTEDACPSRMTRGSRSRTWALPVQYFFLIDQVCRPAKAVQSSRSGLVRKGYPLDHSFILRTTELEVGDYVCL